MNQTIESKNKVLVLEAFDTLFNKRDYAAAERYWSPDYIQHSAHIAPDREGLFNLIKSILAFLPADHRRASARLAYRVEEMLAGLGHYYAGTESRLGTR